MRQETRSVFVADDGAVFENEADALAHEDELRKRQKALAGLKVYRVSHSFDATEGKGYFGKTLIVTDATSAEVIQWCLDMFGSPLDAWYGDGHYQRWLLNFPVDSDTVEWALAHKGYRPGRFQSPWELTVISKDDFTWAGLPKSEFPWPRKAKS